MANNWDGPLFFRALEMSQLFGYLSYTLAGVHNLWKSARRKEGTSCSLGSIAIAIANFGVKVVQDLNFLCGPRLTL